MGNAKITPKIKTELEALEQHLATWLEQVAYAGYNVEITKKRIREISTKYVLPEVTAKTQGYGRIRVTQAEAYPSMNVPKFIEVFGLEVFLQCFEITDGIMILEKWKQLVKDEVVTDTKLAECLDIKEPPTPKVTLAK